jgi:hypothetical protein
MIPSVPHPASSIDVVREHPTLDAIAGTSIHPPFIATAGSLPFLLAHNTSSAAHSAHVSAGYGDLVPHASIQVDAVAIVLAGGGVGGVGVQRMPAVGGLG